MSEGVAAGCELQPKDTSVEKIVGVDLRKAGRAIVLNNGCLQADDPVDVEMMVDDRVERLQRVAVARRRPDCIGEIVAVGVGRPDGVVAAARVLPRNVVAACRLYRAKDRKSVV